MGDEVGRVGGKKGNGTRSWKWGGERNVMGGEVKVREGG